MIIFYITYIAAIFAAVFCPNALIWHSHSVGGDDINLALFCWMYIAIGGFWWLGRHKNSSIIGPIYRIIQAFFIVLFATLFANYAKKEIKEWWKKD